MKAWILLSASIILAIALIDNGLPIGQASNSTKILPPKSSEDLTHQDRVIIKLTPSGTTAEANVSPKNVKVKVGTTVVWENMLPEKVYVQSKPDENHYEGELLNGSYFFPGESREEKLNKIDTFTYDGSNGFGSYYVRGTITVVEEATEEKEIPIKTIENQSANYDKGNVSTNKTVNAKTDNVPLLSSTINKTSNDTQTSTKPTENEHTESGVNNSNTPLIFEDELGSQFKPQNGFETYEDKDVGFTIKYPSGWTVGEEDAQLNSVASFNAPIGRSIVDVRVFPQGTWKSIKDYGDDFKNYEDNTLLAYYRNSTTLIDGKPAFRAIYLTTYNPSVFEESLGYSSLTSKAMMVATHVPEKKSIFALIYFADPKDFEVNRPVVEEMLKTFQIEGKGPVIQEED